MRNVIASVLAIGVVAGLAGCESSAQPGAQSILNYRVDEARGRSVWLTRQGVQIHSAAAQPVSVELPGWTYAGAPHCPPVVALGSAGEILVTSNVIPTLWRIDPATLAVTVHPLTLARDQDKDIGFAALFDRFDTSSEGRGDAFEAVGFAFLGDLGHGHEEAGHQRAGSATDGRQQFHAYLLQRCICGQRRQFGLHVDDGGSATFHVDEMIAVADLAIQRFKLGFAGEDGLLDGCGS